MEDNDDLLRVPDKLRQEIINHRLYRTLAMKALIQLQNLNFWSDIEQEMWKMSALSGKVQPGLLTAILGESAARRLKEQARTAVYEANCYRIAEYKKWMQQQEADIWKRHRDKNLT